MAFKATVDYVQLKVVIDTDSLEPVSVFQNLKSVVTFTYLQNTLQYVNLSAVSVLLDADTKNLYFLAGTPNAESFGFTDLTTFTFDKALADTPILAEQFTFAMQKAVADTTQITENFAKVVQFVRQFDETATMSEAHTYDFSKASTDIIEFSEAQIFVTTKALEDSYDFVDSQVLHLDQASEDFFSFSDTFSRVVSFVRAFADTYGLDDLASAEDNLATQSNLNKTNVVSVAEESLFDFTLGTIAEGISVAESYISSFSPGTIAETANISESAVFSFLAVFADTTTINESIAVELIKGGGPLNVTPMNTNMLNA